MKTLVLAALAATLAVPAAAEVRSVIVQTADLNLASSEGQTRLNNRLWRAADRVCAVSTLRDVWEVRRAGECRDDVLARIKAERSDVLAANSGAAIAIVGR